jgi:hypothetical protein
VKFNSIFNPLGMRDFSVPQDMVLHLLQWFVVDVNKIDGSSSSASASASASSSSLTCKD